MNRPSSRRRRALPRPSPCRARPCLEELESRLVPALPGPNNYVLGLNIPVFEYAGDFNPNIDPNVYGYSITDDRARAAQWLGTLKSQGVHVVRWWLLTAFDQWPFNAQGQVAPPGQTFFSNLDQQLQTAANNGIYVDLTLLDYRVLQQATNSGNLPEDGHAALAEDPTVRQSFLDNFLKPLLTHVAASGYKNNILDYDVMNEPEGVTNGLWGGGPDPSLSQMQAFIGDCVGYIHQYGGGIYATVGSAKPEWASLWQGQGAGQAPDFYCVHYYTNFDANGPGSGLPTYASLGLNAPCVVQEFPTVSPIGSYDPNDTSAYSARWLLDQIHDKGYAGATGWSLAVQGPDDVSDWTDFAPVFQNWENAHQNIIFPQAGLAAPTGLTATAGNGKVTLAWSAVTGASSYNVYRATTSGGEGNTPYATGITSAGYTDTAVTNGITYYYTVTAVSGGSQSGPSAEASAAPLANNQPPPVSVPLHVSGTQLQDAAGNTAVLRGVNISGLEYDYDTESALHLATSVQTAITSWHANLIRLPLNEDMWFGYKGSPTQDLTVEQNYRQMVDQAVSTAAAHYAYVVLDLHWSDMGTWGSNNDQHDLPDDHSTLFWQDVAARYANNPAVLFDPYNEPHDQNWATWLNGVPAGNTITENYQGTNYSYHTPGMQGLVNTIRGTGANNVLLPEGLDWGDDLSGITNGSALSDIDLNIMYQVHLYPGAAQTNAQRDALVSAVAAQYPLYVGEWGTDNTNDGFTGQPDPATWTKTMLAWLDNHKYSWSPWTFNAGFDLQLVSDWNYTPTSYYGQYVLNTLTADNNGQNLPPAPTGVQATAGDGVVTVTWPAVAGADTYYVYRATKSGAEGTTPYTGGGQPFTTLNDKAVTDGTTYYYTVAAVNYAGQGKTSAEVSGTPQAPPATPTGLKATAGNAQVALTWSAVTGAASYNVYRATTSGGEGTTPYASGLTSASYTDTQASNGTTYFYTVTAVNVGGQSKQSAEASATPQGPPAAPTGLKATPDNGQVALSWSAVTGAISYKVYRATTSGGEGGTPYASGLTSASFTDTQVTNGTTYFYTVTALNAGGQSTPSSEVSATPQAPPVAPTGLKATAGNAQVALTWSAVTGAASYNVYRATTSGAEGTTPYAGGLTSASYTDTQATNGTTYFYTVTAVNVGGQSSPSSEVSATPQGPPATPTGLKATPGNAQVALTWSAVTGASSYNVYRTTTSGGEGGTPYASGLTSPSFTDTQVTNGTTYFYTVTAVNAAGQSSPSSEVSATPQANQQPPAAPTGLKATPGNGQVALTWSAVTGAASYNVFRATTSGGEGNTPYASGLSSASFTDTQASNGTTYFYTVTAVNAAGQSSPSSEVSATPQAPPAAPTGLTATPGNAQVTLNWNTVAGATSYDVYRGTASGGEGNPPLVTGLTAATYRDTQVTNGTTYFYTVTAVNAAGQGGPSAEVSATPQGGQQPPAAPTGLAATVGDGDVTLTWSAVAGASSYAVFRATASGAEGATPFASGLTTPAFTDVRAADDTTYFYTVTAVNAAGQSGPSAEVSATPMTRDQQFVEVTFLSILGRPADPTGFAYWAAQLDEGMSRYAVAAAIDHSDEYFANFISAAYGKYLGRAPDRGGLLFWLGQMHGGLTDEQLEANFIGSDEYILGHGGRGAGWVTGMYQNLLGRTPSQTEVQNWVTALGSGATPAEVAYGFAASDEREGQRVTADYVTYLGRAPAQAEVNGWVSSFRSGAANEDVVTGFVGSDEFFDDHTRA